MSVAYVKKILVGKVKKMGNPEASKGMERQWESGICKKNVDDSLWLTKTGLIGDEVADTKHHGGTEKALFAYPTIHYDYWIRELGLKVIGIGAMGENLAVDFIDEHTVCIGDTYQFSDSVIQVSQPRQPCWKPARRFGILDLALQIQETGRTGWYFRVLKEGIVEGESSITLLDRPNPQWTIAKCNEVMHVKADDLKLAEELYSCKLLAETWKQTLSKRLAGETQSINNRVFGPNIV